MLVQAADGHLACRPDWLCVRCADPWPCPAFRALPPAPGELAGRLLPGLVPVLRQAIHDLRGRPEGSRPPQIVQRFLWFLDLDAEEARATALRLRR
ncbi:hypothetical protein ACTWLT_21160 [Micromonospora sp. ZYX-F-536]|uniref:hypothetical protein n=1 Tax=Micromonospora sp. ZYX-F-536 TaxID=3457629 RepID=UPI004040A042